MFSDKSYSPVSFESVTTNEKSQKSANIQTEHVVYESEETQVVETKSIQTQTANETRTNEPKYDEDKLAEFLNRVAPGVFKFLDEQHGTSAFNDYTVGSNNEPAVNIQLINRINTLDLSEFKGKVSSVTWSTGGGTLAIGHSVTQHKSWCNDITKVDLYNLSKDNLLMTVPTKSLEVSSCVTTLLYHPDEPSILAAGLFDGDVMVWNLREESLIAPLFVCTHGEMVTQIYWHSRILNDASALITSGGDGYIYIHRLTINFTQSSTQKKYKILKEKNLTEKSALGNEGEDKNAEAGLHITSFDFSAKDHKVFVVGTLCGRLYKCNLDQTIPIEGTEMIFDPVISEYDKHKSTVTCVKSAPTQNLFVSSGADREVHIYDFDQPASLKIITLDSTPVQISWHFGNFDVFLAYGAGPEVKFFNVKTGRPLSKTMLYSENRENSTCLSFNTKREMVAIGDTKGNLEIWRMSRSLSN
ncbi:hypothetical protein TKK_0011799 [Trichogramma kaykai]|uniref:WD repeat-containing protein 55 homolog n=1 Tax=Trichogramma kaykai TaxID=54128 RepID=A0ABD2WRT1_9HYME